MPLDDARPEYASTYSFMFGDTLLAGMAAPNATNALRVTSLKASDWTVRTSNASPGSSTPGLQGYPGGALRFLAKTLIESVVLVPLNTITTERYTVYYNFTVTSNVIY